MQTYQAAELLNYTSSETKQSDIFALGCIFYYALSKGVHPFKDTMHYNEDGILKNIKEGKAFTNKILNYDEEYKKYSVTDLINQMTNKNHEKRPCCEFILNNVVFWDRFKIFKFIRLCHLNESEMKCFSLNNCESIIGNAWTKQIDPMYLQGPSNETDKNIRVMIRIMSSIVST